VTSDRDRCILAGLERDLRATDPELCDRLGRLEARPGPARTAFGALVSTRAIAGWLVAFVVAVLLGLSGTALVLVVVVFAAVVVRLARSQPPVPGPPREHRPPFGRPG
jgi:hypothetical protein